MQSALKALRDIQGVFGSFVLTSSGELLDKDLPAVFHDEVFLETGPRIMRLCEAIEHGGEALDSLVLRFADHKLHVRRSRGGLLCVITDVGTNVPALRMAPALVARRLGNVLSDPSEEAATPSEPPPPPRDSAPPPLSTRLDKRQSQTYRGRPVM